MFKALATRENNENVREQKNQKYIHTYIYKNPARKATKVAATRFCASKNKYNNNNRKTTTDDDEVDADRAKAGCTRQPSRLGGGRDSLQCGRWSEGARQQTPQQQRQQQQQNNGKNEIAEKKNEKPKEAKKRKTEQNQNGRRAAIFWEFRVFIENCSLAFVGQTQQRECCEGGRNRDRTNLSLWLSLYEISMNVMKSILPARLEKV